MGAHPHRELIEVIFITDEWHTRSTDSFVMSYPIGELSSAKTGSTQYEILCKACYCGCC